MDTTENRALYANTAITTLLCAVGFGVFLSSAFGMNLDNWSDLASERGGFLSVTVLSLASIGVLYCAGLFYFKRNKMFPREAKK